jgi:TPR repeat protein
LIAQSATSDEAWFEAAHWYQRAADAGHPAAMLSLAQLHERGLGMPADRIAALAWYRRAQKAGQAEAAAEVERLQADLRPPEYAS